MVIRSIQSDYPSGSVSSLFARCYTDNTLRVARTLPYNNSIASAALTILGFTHSLIFRKQESTPDGVPIELLNLCFI